MAIVVGMITITGWIAFGAGTVLLVFMLVACTFVGIRRLRRARRE